MEFTFKAYRSLLELLREKGYTFCGYHDYESHPRSVILRHDVDQSIHMALPMAQLEAEMGISSTYFVLLTSDFYNVASMESRRSLHRLQELGHEVGLHFDEVAYGPLSQEECVENILHEKELLSSIIGQNVTSVSMHRPSKRTLEGDLKIPGMVNSYGQTFFRDFKYLSDSRRRWREPVEEIIASGAYDRLHILTHAFWYHEQEKSIEDTVGSFIQNANLERYDQMMNNITDLPSILQRKDVIQ